MATTVGNFSAIDDSEVDAESPITETLMTRMRDNSYWIDAGTRRTTETSSTKVLTPNGSGGVQWVEVATIADPGVDGTKGAVSGILNSSTYYTLTTLTSGIFMWTLKTWESGAASSFFSIVIDLSDDSFVASSSIAGAAPTSNTGTLSASDTVVGQLDESGGAINLSMRRSSGNLQYVANGAINSIAGEWIVL